MVCRGGALLAHLDTQSDVHPLADIQTIFLVGVFCSPRPLAQHALRPDIRMDTTAAEKEQDKKKSRASKPKVVSF